VKLETNEYHAQQNLFRTYLSGTFIKSLSVGREAIMRIIRMVDESGLNAHAIDMGKLEQHVGRLHSLRNNYGELVELSTFLSPMSLSTNTYYTFLLYLYLISTATFVFIIETVVMHTLKLICLVRTFVSVFVFRIKAYG